MFRSIIMAPLSMYLQLIRNQKYFPIVLSTCIRNFVTCSVVLSSSYVKTVRDQQNIKQASRYLNLNFYRNGQYLVFYGEQERLLVKQSDHGSMHTVLWKNFDDVSKLGLNAVEDSVFLSMNEKTLCRFAVELPSTSREKKEKIETQLNGKFVAIRATLFTLPIADSILVSQAHSLLDWNLRHKFCSDCGGQLKSETLVGAHKVCSVCNKKCYPSISPVGISLVTNQDYSKALLVRQPMFLPGMYTCIAGFIEFGETLEENVRREVAEEVGLDVDKITYIGSQHWSLPESRLMLACMATVQDENFTIDNEELEDARWCTPQQVQAALNRVNSKTAKLLSESSELWVPPRGAIAHDLIKHWLRVYHS